MATDWLADLSPGARLIFSRFTQLGFLRLLTAEAVMQDEVLNQREAWAVYDLWRRDDRVDLMDEPPELEHRFRSLTQSVRPTPKDWADSYLSAFAAAGQLTVVTFDRAFRRKAGALLLLGE
ncbi:MAG: PIN domain-containing protein [Vicinamibacterales bacterium]|nr:PIN domain-containing protein [Vicinamibacterales bacterium]